MLQDAHIHLQDAGEEGARIIVGAEGRGIDRFFCNGSGPSDWEAVRYLASSSDKVLPFYGLHPWYVEEAGAGWYDELKRYLAMPGSAIGEIGLDKVRRNIDFAKQSDAFRAQLALAVEYSKPFAVHCVQAWEPLISELRRAGIGDGSGPPFIVHWFSGSVSVGLEIVKAGGYLSFSPRISDTFAEKQREALASVPEERMLLETDYPYMPGANKLRAVSADEYFSALEELYQKAADLRGVDAGYLAQRVWDNGTVFVRRALAGKGKAG
jgi:TatD DNase family protein